MSEAGVMGYEPRKSGRPDLLRRGDESESQRGVAADIAIDAGLQASPGEFRS